LQADWAKLLAYAVSVAIVLLTIWLTTDRKPPAEVPQKPFAVPEIQQQAETEWYVKFSVKDQKSTAYVEQSQAPRPSSGGRYYIGGVAVHPIYPGADPRQPIIPYGTLIYLKEPLTVNGRPMSAFKVIDTGDIYYGRYGSTPYWFDIYWGNTNYYSNQSASKFGVKTVDYYWYEPWR
jgi:cytoskeletal protein RodZ